MTFVPNCQTNDAANSTLGAHFYDLSQWLLTNGDHWNVVDTVAGDADELEALLIESVQGTIRFLFWHEKRSTDPDLYHMALDPGGTMEIADPAATASDAWSGLRTREHGTSWFGGTADNEALGTKWAWMGAPDAFALLIFSADETTTEMALHAGRTYNPAGLYDEQHGLDGNCLWWGAADRPDNSNSFMGPNATATGKISDTDWDHTSGADFNNGRILGNPRPSPIPILGGDNNQIAGDPVLGLSRYVIEMPDSEGTGTVWPSTESNLGWMAFTEGSSTRICMMWNKTVTL